MDNKGSITTISKHIYNAHLWAPYDWMYMEVMCVKDPVLEQWQQLMDSVRWFMPFLNVFSFNRVFQDI